MVKKIIHFMAICLFFTCLAKKETTPFPYPVLFRDHTFFSLSDKGKEAYYAVNIHPSCVQKKGECIPRAKCIGREMLYISRICYRLDLVCCYDNSLKFPSVAAHTDVTTSNVTTTTAPTEPPVLP